MKIPFFKPSFSNLEEQAVLDVMKGGWLTTGSKCRHLESEFENLCNPTGLLNIHAVATNSATSALLVGLRALGFGTEAYQGAEVITTAMTFISPINTLVSLGASPVFCDIKPDSLNINPDKIEKLITKNTKAIMVTHMAGHSADMRPIWDLAEKHGLLVIEDAAHCLPTSYKGIPVGSNSDLTFFSFYATKTVSAGEGGMAIVKSAKVANEMRKIRLHGISRDVLERYTKAGNWEYDTEYLGEKANMLDLTAAIALVQLSRQKVLHFRRLSRIDTYAIELDGYLKINQVTNEDSGHLCIAQTNGDHRDELFSYLADRDINCSVHFKPVYKMTGLQDYVDYDEAKLPVTEKAYKRIISLPLYPDMSLAEQTYVIKTIKEFYNETK